MIKRPKHVFVIMDGNGRWAIDRNRPRTFGHQAGVHAAKRAVQYAQQTQIPFLSLFAFGIDNQNRPDHEVNFLMTLITDVLTQEIQEFKQHNVRLRVIGDRARWTSKMLQQITEAETLTADNTGLVLIVLLYYSGRWDVFQAAQRVSEWKESELKFSNCLALSDFPDPDLLIRTGGEKRLSNSMLWQLAYSEIFFSDVLWPDFDASEFESAITFYQMRQRRFGKIPEQME